MLLWMSLWFFTDKPLTLEGFPLQMEFEDLQNDGYSDLVALMLYNRTIGEIDAYYEGGGVKALYEETTLREKYLVWIPQTAEGFGEPVRYNLGLRRAKGFKISHSKQIYLWLEHQIEKLALDPKPRLLETIELPASGAAEISSVTAYDWLISYEGKEWIIVPDLGKYHLFQLNGDQQTINMPMDFFRVNNEGGLFQMDYPLPLQAHFDGDQKMDLIFNNQKQWLFETLDGARSHFENKDLGEFVIKDMDGDHLADLMVVKEIGEIDGPKDLPKIKSLVKIFKASSPLTFSETPTFEGELGGFILNGADEEIEALNPYFDLNRDGRIDLGGFAFKFSFFQVARGLSTGRMTLKFLLHFHLNEGDRFRTLAGGPFEIKWRINLRNMKMPEFAQLSGDLDGDGWLDIFIAEDKKLRITPLDGAGIQSAKSWKYKLPKALREPDEIFAHAMDPDPQDELIILKFEAGQTQIGVLEVSK